MQFFVGKVASTLNAYCKLTCGTLIDEVGNNTDLILNFCLQILDYTDFNRASAKI